MKKSLTILFYLVAFGAVSYFLREYLDAPKIFIISLIISLAIILFLVSKKSSYTKFIGITLILIHGVRLVGYFIPVYPHTPDIRQRYRKAPNVLMAIFGETTGTTVTLEANGQIIDAPVSDFITPRPIYQGNTIATAGASIASDGRMIVGLRDGSDIILFPQTTIGLEKLSTDFIALRGSETNILLQGGIIALHTHRSSFAPQDRSVRAGDISFSCRECIVAYSGSRGSIASSEPFSWRASGGEIITLSGGSYTFTQSSLSTTNNKSLAALLRDTSVMTNHRTNYYNTLRATFVSEQRGRSMDTSVLLGTISKVKMAIVGLFDRTYREKYDNLMLYEYIRGNSDTIPPRFSAQESLYKFIQ